MDFRSPLKALFPGARSSVLAVLARSPEPLTIRQIAERCDITHPSVATHVDALEHLGVVHRRIAGRSHLVSLNDSLTADLVRQIDDLTHRATVAMRQMAEELIDPAPFSVILFGSFVRGSAGPDSDIDVAVIAPPGLADDEHFCESIGRWTDRVSALLGNPVAELIVGIDDLAAKQDLALWESIRTEGQVISGKPLQDLMTSPAGIGS